LLNYGFIVENNDGNEFPITIELSPKETPLFPFKANILNNKELKRTFRIQTNFTEPSVNELISFVRFFVFNEDINSLINIMILEKNNKELDNSNTPSNKSYSSYINNLPGISIKNELATMQEIDKLVTSCLNEYETSIDKDLEILQSDQKEKFLTNNQRNCLLMRIGEKRILIFFKNFANYIIDLFSLSAKDIKKKVKKDFPQQCPYEEYITDVVLNLVRKASSK